MVAPQDYDGQGQAWIVFVGRDRESSSIVESGKMVYIVDVYITNIHHRNFQWFERRYT